MATIFYCHNLLQLNVILTKTCPQVASENNIKEEKVEPDESEATEMGFEYESLVTDLVGNEEETKEHSSLPDASFNHSMNAESYSAEAGPSGLQPVSGWCHKSE